MFYLLFETSSFNYRLQFRIFGISGSFDEYRTRWSVMMSYIFESYLTTSAALLRSSASPSSLTILPRRFSSQFCFFSASEAKWHNDIIYHGATTRINEIIGPDLRSCFLYISGFSKPSFGFSIIRLLTRGFSSGFSSGLSSFCYSVQTYTPVQESIR